MLTALYWINLISIPIVVTILALDYKKDKPSKFHPWATAKIFNWGVASAMYVPQELWRYHSESPENNALDKHHLLN